MQVERIIKANPDKKVDIINNLDITINGIVSFIDISIQNDG
jgi:hypothetical protein